MKVYELISALVDMPAGHTVYVTAYPAGTHNELSGVNIDDDMVYLNGDGRYTDDLDNAMHGDS